MAIICNNKRTFHRVPVCSKLPPKCISAVCWFFCHSIHPFRSTLSVKPAVLFSTQGHRSGSRSITEGGCPAPLSPQPLQTQAPPAALPAVNQNSYSCHHLEFTDSPCKYPVLLLSRWSISTPCPAPTLEQHTSSWTSLPWCEEENRRKPSQTSYPTFREIITIVLLCRRTESSLWPLGSLPAKTLAGLEVLISKSHSAPSTSYSPLQTTKLISTSTSSTRLSASPRVHGPGEARRCFYMTPDLKADTALFPVTEAQLRVSPDSLQKLPAVDTLSCLSEALLIYHILHLSLDWLPRQLHVMNESYTLFLCSEVLKSQFFLRSLPRASSSWAPTVIGKNKSDSILDLFLSL